MREYAQRLLGLTCEQFSQVIVLPQGEFRKLLLSNSTEKSKIFQTLFQTEKWERITKCAQSMAEDLEQRCGGLLSARQAVLESEGVQARRNWSFCGRLRRRSMRKVSLRRKKQKTI